MRRSVRNFRLNVDRLIEMNDAELLMEFINHPREYLMEYYKRIHTLNEVIIFNKAGLVTSHTDNERVQNSGNHSDITANMAIRQMECSSIINDDTGYEDIKKISKDNPKEIRLLIALKTAVCLYNKVLILFPDDVRQIINLRNSGLTIEQIAEEIDKSVSYVNERIKVSRAEMNDKAGEVIAYLNYVAC